ncbi:hypothetical protein JCM16303_003424 [Sporobolomyces ruberrimus]
MVADWTEATPTWQNPHERSFYRESIPPIHPSFNVGTPQSHPNSNVQYPNSFTGLSKDMEEKQRRLQDALDKVLGPEYVQNRPGGGGTKLTYLEGWRAINLANEVFGYNGWFTDIKYLETDFCDYNPESGRWSMGVTAIVRVRLPDGASHEDIGYGKLENTKSKGDGLDKCKKEAVTDGLKRALRHFGKLLGNCLYDKNYLTQLSSMKASKPKFDWDSLYKPEHHALHAPSPKHIPPKAFPPPGFIDASSMPPPPNPVASTSKPVPPPPPHPPHMQRAQTIGASTNQRPLQANTSKPENQVPQRSATISHASSTSSTKLNPNPNPNPNDRPGSIGGEFGLGSDDDSFYAAAMDLEESGAGGGNGNGADDSGFAEASFIQQQQQEVEKSPNNNSSRTSPPAGPGQPPHLPTPVSAAPTAAAPGSISVAEQNRLKAVAKRDAKMREKAEAAQLLLHQQQQQQQSTTTGASTAAQMLKNQPLRPPVAPPSRTTSINHASSKPPPRQQPLQGGTLPTLNVGNGIVQAQQTSSVPRGGGESTLSSVQTSPGFTTARGVKRQLDESGGNIGGGPAPQRAHTISTSNPSTMNRKPLGEVEVTDQGHVKQYRASS